MDAHFLQGASNKKADSQRARSLHLRHLRMGPDVGLAGGCMYGAVTVSSRLQDLPDDIQMIDVINVATLGATAVDKLAQEPACFVVRRCFVQGLGCTMIPEFSLNVF